MVIIKLELKVLLIKMPTHHHPGLRMLTAVGSLMCRCQSLGSRVIQSKFKKRHMVVTAVKGSSIVKEEIQMQEVKPLNDKVRAVRKLTPRKNQLSF